MKIPGHLLLCCYIGKVLKGQSLHHELCWPASLFAEGAQPDPDGQGQVGDGGGGGGGHHRSPSLRCDRSALKLHTAFT